MVTQKIKMMIIVSYLFKNQKLSQNRKCNNQLYDFLGTFLELGEDDGGDNDNDNEGHNKYNMRTTMMTMTMMRMRIMFKLPAAAGPVISCPPFKAAPTLNPNRLSLVSSLRSHIKVIMTMLIIETNLK